MSVTASAPFPLPDPRRLADAGTWLAEWCAAQPDRSFTEKIDELAGFAGCSPTTMQRAIEEGRDLSLAHAHALLNHIPLPAGQLQHLRDLFELPHLPPGRARKRRERVLAAVAKTQGARWATTDELLEAAAPEPAVTAALSAAVASLEDDCPALGLLLRGSVPPLRMAQLREAAETEPPAARVAPRMWSLSGPQQGGALAHLGFLRCADEALLRLPSQDRSYQALTTSADEEASLAFDAVCRWPVDALRELSEQSELRMPEGVSVFGSQRFCAAGPFLGGRASLPGLWQGPSVNLPRLDAPPVVRPSPVDGPPHPAGGTWFPTYLKAWRAWAARTGRAHNDTQLAAETGLSRSAIYDLSVGATRFSSDHIYRFVKVFGLEGDREGQVALEAMAMVACASDLREQARLLAGLRPTGVPMDQRDLAAETWFARSRWFAHVICALATVDGFQPLHGWLSRALKGRVTGEAAQEALTALGVMGMLRQDAQGRVVVGVPPHDLQGPHAKAALFALHSGLLRQYQAELSLPDAPDLRPEVHLLGLSSKSVPRAREVVDEGWRRLVAVAEATEARRLAGAPMDRVLIISWQYYPFFRYKIPPRKPRSRV